MSPSQHGGHEDDHPAPPAPCVVHDVQLDILQDVLRSARVLGRHDAEEPQAIHRQGDGGDSRPVPLCDGLSHLLLCENDDGHVAEEPKGKELDLNSYFQEFSQLSLKPVTPLLVSLLLSRELVAYTK